METSSERNKQISNYVGTTAMRCKVVARMATQINGCRRAMKYIFASQNEDFNRVSLAAEIYFIKTQGHDAFFDRMPSSIFFGDIISSNVKWIILFCIVFWPSVSPTFRYISTFCT